MALALLAQRLRNDGVEISGEPTTELLRFDTTGMANRARVFRSIRQRLDE